MNVQKKLGPKSRLGNNGGSRDANSQKILELTENFKGNYPYFVTKMKFWKKIQSFCHKNEMLLKIIAIFIAEMEFCWK